MRRQRRLGARGRRGFTLVETLIAMSLLVGVVLTMAMSTTVSARRVASSGSRSRAQALLDRQIARARSWPTYSTLSALTDIRYNGTSNGLVTSTTVNVDTASGRNLTRVAVTVTGTSTAQLALPIRRSISIAAP